MKKCGNGFTIFEILVVISVTVALVVLCLLFIAPQIAKARDAKRKADINKIGKYIEEYFDDKSCYPISVPTCGTSLHLNDKTYITYLPCDPKTGNPYVYVSETSDCPKWFQLYANLEITKDKIIDDLGCRNGCGPDCQFNFGTASTNVRLNPYCQEILPTASPTVPSTTNPLQYVCAPSGVCEAFAHPELSGCPDIFLDDPTCQNQCSNPKNRCHDARGKTN